MISRPLTFLSDYGHEDEFAGVCRGVIAAVAAASSLIDLTHGIDPGDIQGGALALRNSLPHCPAGVHLAVVDPGVGGPRRAVALRTAREERFLVGPDNGLLAVALAEFGGAVEAVDIGSSPVRREPVSATFHGRDIFAPVAARLALGDSLADLGDPFDPAELTPLELPAPEIEQGRITAHVINTDRFGNLTLNVAVADLPGRLQPGQGMKLDASAGEIELSFARAFSDAAPGGVLLFEDSSGSLAIAVNMGSAAQVLMAARGDELVLRPG